VSESPRIVVVTGSESTGKTTLARELAEHFGVLWVPEQSRRYAESAGRILEARDVEAIARWQHDAEEAGRAEAARHGHRFLFLDTDLVSTVVYARHYYGECPPWIITAARTRLASDYLLCDVDVPWVSDSVRDRPFAREEIHDSFRLTFKTFGVHPHLIQGLGRARLDAALAGLMPLR
jgi:NadR type nicotinamide-nucleotide adenylyltransferase